MGLQIVPAPFLKFLKEIAGPIGAVHFQTVAKNGALDGD